MALPELMSEDRPLAAKLLTDYWAERGMGRYDSRWAHQYLLEGHRKEIEKDEFFAYREGDALIGIVSLVTYSSNVAEIRDLVVKPDRRGEGHAGRILKALVEQARKGGVRKLYALTSPRTGYLFISAGFEREGLLRDHFADGEDMLFMGKRL